jgi:hypothetical protein
MLVLLIAGNLKERNYDGLQWPVISTPLIINVIVVLLLVVAEP